MNHEEVKIYIASDYRGNSLKNEIIPYVDACHAFLNIEDLGNNSDSPDDYNDAASSVAKKILNEKDAFGILICGSAHGVCIAANRYKGIRACNCATVESARLAREHDNANILCLSAELTSPTDAEEIVKTFFHTKFAENERRSRRIIRLDEE